MSQNGTPRLSIKHMILLVLLDFKPLTEIDELSPTLREIQDGLAYHFGEYTSRPHMRKQLRELEAQGAIETSFFYLSTGKDGPQAQANRYRIVDIAKGLDLELTPRKERIRKEAREKRETPRAILPGKFYGRNWRPSPAYEEGYAPYAEALRCADLGPTFPKGDPRNIAKVRRVRQLLIDKKRELRGNA